MQAPVFPKVPCDVLNNIKNIYSPPSLQDVFMSGGGGCGGGRGGEIQPCFGVLMTGPVAYFADELLTA